jgi:uncharacterized protein involved in exopolysaccharide biosynthesis
MLPQADIGDAAAAALAHVEDPHLVDYVRIVYKKRWLVAITFLLSLAGAAAYLHRATPQYEATVELFIGRTEGTPFISPRTSRPSRARSITTRRAAAAKPRAGETDDRSLKLWDGAEVTQPVNSELQWLSDLKARLMDLEARITGSPRRFRESSAQTKLSTLTQTRLSIRPVRRDAEG